MDEADGRIRCDDRVARCRGGGGGGEQKGKETKKPPFLFMKGPSRPRCIMRVREKACAVVI